ncbi:MAG TPA: IS200/IS605 family transposase [bacterium]|nr:IS200/IS605 family transposase [bacterium]
MDLRRTHAHHRIYHHLVWSTKKREPLLTPFVEMVVHSFLIDKTQSLGAEILAINGMEDHVHLLVRLAPKQNISKFVKDLKGSSSHFLNEVLEGHRVESVMVFQWQPGYAVFSVGEKDLSIVGSYIRKQKEHHRKRQLVEEWESTSRQQTRSHGINSVAQREV